MDIKNIRRFVVDKVVELNHTKGNEVRLQYHFEGNGRKILRELRRGQERLRS